MESSDNFLSIEPKYVVIKLLVSMLQYAKYTLDQKVVKTAALENSYIHDQKSFAPSDVLI